MSYHPDTTRTIFARCDYCGCRIEATGHVDMLMRGEDAAALTELATEKRRLHELDCPDARAAAERRARENPNAYGGTLRDALAMDFLNRNRDLIASEAYLLADDAMRARDGILRERLEARVAELEGELGAEA